MQNYRKQFSFYQVADAATVLWGEATLVQCQFVAFLGHHFFLWPVITIRLPRYQLRFQEVVTLFEFLFMYFFFLHIYIIRFMDHLLGRLKKRPKQTLLTRRHLPLTSCSEAPDFHYPSSFLLLITDNNLSDFLHLYDLVHSSVALSQHLSIFPPWEGCKMAAVWWWSIVYPLSRPKSPSHV